MPPPFTAFDRSVALARLADERFDVLVVGGGVTGAGVALDAAARGLKVALVERADFASGTSSKSSKLVHGGLRYLQQREFGLVHESLDERHVLLANAPHLVELLTFLVPLFGKDGIVNRSVAASYSTALWLYDLFGGWKIGRRHRRVRAEEVAAHFPTLQTERLVAGFLYYDARADDARLTLAVLRTAVLDHGAVALNYASVDGLAKDAAGRVRGAHVRAEDAGGDGEASFEVRAETVVNATGVWADELRGLDEPRRPHSIRPAKGVHVAVPRERLPCDLAAVLPVPGDRRSIFVIPWGAQTYVGTTDTDYEGPLDRPPVDAADVDYLLKTVNAHFQGDLRPADVTGAWAGLRPLLAASGPHGRAPSARTADLSRRHQVHVSGSGLVTITGGKLTTYRKMAADTVDAVVGLLGRGPRRSPTRRLPLRGAVGHAELLRADAPARLGASRELLEHLHGRYGGEAVGVLELARTRPELLEPLVAGLPYLAAEAVYAARYEMAHHLEDALARRTRALLLDERRTLEAAANAARLLGGELGWDERRAAAEVAAFRSTAAAWLGATTTSGIVDGGDPDRSSSP